MQANNLRVIKLAGSPRNRGRIHGEELRTEIRELSEAHADAISRVYAVPADEYLKQFGAYQKFSGAISAYCPDLLEEVRGIADGAGLPVETILLLQLSDEEWVFGRTIWTGGFRSKCTEYGHSALSRRLSDHLSYCI
jgi:isopenicillin-N N-acyltransferase-like protein